MADEKNEHLDLVWGLENIAAYIGRSTRSTFDMLSKGDLPGRQVGTRWVVSRERLARFFLGEEAA